jgi:glycerol-3-phosphate acyltransferase PlsY
MVLAIVAIAYLLGSIPVGYIMCKVVAGNDVRDGGSGATGATNVARRLGLKYAIVVSIFDILKGVAAVVIAGVLAPEIDWIRGIAAVVAILGHCFPVWIGFRGGKGINTALGAAIVIAPLAVAIALGGFVVTLLIKRFVSAGSLIAVIFFAISVFVLGERIGAGNLDARIIAVAMPLIVFFTHRKNIVRIFKGKELPPTK